MKCPLCGHDNRADRRFCGECGATLALACATCGFFNEAGEKFCGGCGEPLGKAPPVPKFTDPATYTPKHLAERILTSSTGARS